MVLASSSASPMTLGASAHRGDYPAGNELAVAPQPDDVPAERPHQRRQRDSHHGDRGEGRQQAGGRDHEPHALRGGAGLGGEARRSAPFSHGATQLAATNAYRIPPMIST